MENTKRLSVKKTSVLMVVLTLLVSVVLFATFGNNITAACASSSAEQQVSADRTVFSKATLNDDFADDTVVIELNREHSLKFFFRLYIFRKYNSSCK